MARKKNTPPAPPAGGGVNIDALVKALDKRLGDRAPIRFSQEGAYPLRESVPTGLASLDAALGGGWPVPSIITVEGAESAGKSTLVSYLAGVFQRAGFVPYRVETEEGGSRDWDERLGVNPETALGRRTSSTDEALLLFLEGARAMAKLDMKGLMIFDSLAASQPSKELARDLGKSMSPGERAGLLARVIPRLVDEMRDRPLAVVIVNQYRDNIGAVGPFAPKHSTPGGRALKHFAHCRLEVTRIGQIRKQEQAVGIHSKIRTVKNKLHPPLQSAWFDIYFNPPRVVEGDPDGDTE